MKNQLNNPGVSIKESSFQNVRRGELLRNLISIFFIGMSALISQASEALEFQVRNLCNDQAAFEKKVPSQESTLGDLTVAVFNQNQIPFQGDRSGLKAIFNSPVGDAALEVLSDSQMRAYGWCVLVDGKSPDRMPDEVLISEKTKTIRWFYAFALYDQGQWKDFCTPAHVAMPSQVCP